MFMHDSTAAVVLWTHPDDSSIDQRLEANEARVPVVSRSAVDRAAETAGCNQTQPQTGFTLEKSAASV